MKLRERKPMYVEEDIEEEKIVGDGNRIDPITNPLSDEGAFRLSAGILQATHDDYINALQTIMRLESEAKKIYQKIRKYDVWEYYQKEAKELLGKDFSKLNHKESESVVLYKLLKKPIEPTKEEVALYSEYVNALKEKDECEAFYLSKNYYILTLGKSLNGREVIKKLKAKVGFGKWIFLKN